MRTTLTIDPDVAQLLTQVIDQLAVEDYLELQ